jgi:hypothetical protein
LLKAYQTEVDNIPRYQKQLADLQQAGAAVASEDQASKFSITVNNQAALSGVVVNNSVFGNQRGASSTKPNQFFDEQRGNITVTTDEKSLVDFLYNLGVGGSLIRVRDMSLNTDGPRQKLMGTITLVASYARKAPPKATPAAPAPAAIRTNVAPAMAANTRSTNQGATPNIAATKTTNAPASGGWMQRLKNWGTGGASKSNAPTKK